MSEPRGDAAFPAARYSAPASGQGRTAPVSGREHRSVRLLSRRALFLAGGGTTIIAVGAAGARWSQRQTRAAVPEGPGPAAPGTAPGTVPGAAAIPASSGGPARGARPPAPDFSVTTVGGQIFRLSDQRGKAVVLFFTGPG